MHALKQENSSVSDSWAYSFDCKCLRKSAFFNKRKHSGKSGQLGEKEKGFKKKKKTQKKYYLKCQWQKLGRLEAWYLNCKDLTGDSRLIKHWTRLDGWNGSIIILTLRRDLQEGSPGAGGTQESTDPSTEKAFREFSFATHFYILPYLKEGS